MSAERTPKKGFVRPIEPRAVVVADLPPEADIKAYEEAARILTGSSAYPGVREVVPVRDNDDSVRHEVRVPLGGNGLPPLIGVEILAGYAELDTVKAGHRGSILPDPRYHPGESRPSTAPQG
jgi:hypothetical protein